MHINFKTNSTLLHRCCITQLVWVAFQSLHASEGIKSTLPVQQKKNRQTSSMTIAYAQNLRVMETTQRQEAKERNDIIP